MTREQALNKARENHKAYRDADLAHMFKGGPEPVDSEYGHKHGWFVVGGFSFSEEEITGIPYDMHKGGWAWV